MKKRLLALILTVVMVMTVFTACGKKTENADGGVNIEDDDKNEDVKDDDNGDDGEEKRASILNLYKERFCDGAYSNSEVYSGYIAYMEYEVLHLMEEDAKKYPELNEALENLAKGAVANIKEVYKDAKDAAYEEFDEEHPENCMLYNIKELYSVRRADETVVSIEQSYEAYLGGAHGQYATLPDNFDTKTGESINFTDVVTDVDKAYERISAIIKEKYADSLDIFLSDLTFTEYKNNEFPQLFMIDYDGITVIYNPYDIAPYSVGQITVKLSYEDNKDILNEKYFTNVPESYALQLSPFDEYITDIDGDGVLDSMTVIPYFPELNENAESIAFIINGENHEIKDEDMYVFSINTYLVKTKGGKCYVYLEGIGLNDYTTCFVYEIGKDSVKKVKEVDGNVADLGYITEPGEDYKWLMGMILDPEKVSLSVRTDLFGTCQISKVYAIGEDGIPVTAQEVYTFTTTVDYTVKKAMTFKKVDEEGNEIGEYELKVGEHVYAYRTDADTYVDAKLSDGTIVRFNVTSKEWPYCIDGVDIQELFEDVFFAG
ncbi:MAG: DUF3298 and DUF4163 domain-containing protein [Lachnospiraceae bacterium]|nr:DUF3298 and DUF4163 domain-containing protein [Lachnospiraceae bacterium]